MGHAEMEIISVKTINRFLEKVTKCGSNGCWEWKATKNDGGYGLFWFGGWMQKAHRVSYILHRGTIPSNLHVLHRCDNRSCVNPDHLFLGTNSDNVADKVLKGRQARLVGEKHPMSILKETDVIHIRRQLSEGMSKLKIAKMYGVTDGAIYRIAMGKTWKHV